ncbi:hypothetical protein BVRB_6g130950 [Beta vulgaris subsp. vulgaris]|nr:hypothetical protein BVRB_6g130950 [Beta vulgaris subsp. vulgaris]
MGGAISKIQFTRRSNTPNNQQDVQGLSYKKYYYKFWNRSKMVGNGNKAMTLMAHDTSNHASVRPDRYLLSQATMRSDSGVLSPVSNESNITMSSVSSLPKENHQQNNEVEVVEKVEYEKKDQFTHMSDKNDDDNWEENQEEGNSRFARSPSFKVYVTHINHKIDDSKKSRSNLKIENKPSKSGELQNEPTTSSNRQGETMNSSNKASVRQRTYT